MENVTVGSGVTGRVSSTSMNAAAGPKNGPVNVLAGGGQSTANAAPVAPVSRQVRRANARRTEKQISRHMNETVLKKNRKR